MISEVRPFGGGGRESIFEMLFLRDAILCNVIHRKVYSSL